MTGGAKVSDNATGLGLLRRNKTPFVKCQRFDSSSIHRKIPRNVVSSEKSDIFRFFWTMFDLFAEFLYPVKPPSISVLSNNIRSKKISL
jgi:hypothetical protein